MFIVTKDLSYFHQWGVGGKNYLSRNSIPRTQARLSLCFLLLLLRSIVTFPQAAVENFETNLLSNIIHGS